MSKLYRKLTRHEILQIQDAWRMKFHEKSKPQVNSPEYWFEVIIDFMLTRGDELYTKELRESEFKVIETGKSEEYISALMTVVDAAGLSEHDRIVVMLTASPEDRDAALRKIRL
jgi:hypothetical protein